MKHLRQTALLLSTLPLLTGCLYQGEIFVSDDEFSLTYTSFNSSQSATFILKSIDSISVEIENTSGTVDLVIRSISGGVAYQGRGQDTAKFVVHASTNGNHEITVTGHSAVGRTSFLILRG